MKNHRMRRRAISIAALAVALAASPVVAADAAKSSADAQPGAAPSFGDGAADGDILVTARHRSENVQSVPLSISTLTRADIETQNIRRTQDYFNRSSSVSLTRSMSAGFSMVTIRGISQARGGETPIAVWVDGLPNVDSLQFTGELGDVESIEVLKGPQGALYGPNAVAGAINITTIEAPTHPQGAIEAGYGNGSTYTANARYGDALTRDGNLRFVISGNFRRYGGLLENETLDRKADRRTSAGGRFKLSYDPSEDLKIDLVADIAHDRGGGVTWIYQPLFGVDSARVANLPITSNNLGTNQRDIHQVGLKVTKSLGWGEIKNTVSWSHLREFFDGDSWPYSPGTSLNPLPGFAGEGTTHSYNNLNGITEEIRLSSRPATRFEWTTGVYFQYVNRFNSYASGSDLGEGILHVYRHPNGAGTSNPTTQFGSAVYHNLNFAWFGQATYHVTDRLEATAGMRYEYDIRRQTNTTPDPFNSAPRGERSTNFHDPQPQFNILWRPADHYSIYANISRAFQSGGFNAVGASQLGNNAGITTVTEIFPKERATTYEIGFKTKPAHWLTFNGAGYFTNLENQAYYAYVPEVNTSLTVPIDDVHVWGYEFDARAELVRGFSLRGSIGYSHSEIHRYSVNPSYDGNTAPYTPNYTANIGWTYDRPVGEAFRVVANFDWRLQGRQYYDPGDTTSRQPIHFVEATLGFGSADRRWTATLWGKNLLNKTYLAEYVLGGYAYRGEPRTYGGSLKYQF